MLNYSDVQMIYYRNSGTTRYFQRPYYSNLLYTDGVMDFQETLEAYWLGLNEEVYELVKLSLKSCLGDEQEFHKQETERINTEIIECKEILKKMYLDQLNSVLEYDLWVNLKNDKN